MNIKNPKKEKSKKLKTDPKDQKIAELTNILKRVQADFENYKKRAEQEKKQNIEYASQELIKKLLPLLDSFELALKNKKNKEEYNGIQLLYAQLIQILEKQGLRKIDASGKKFDPYLHEVLMQEACNKPENTVIEELQEGYMLNLAVIRHSKVKIAKNEKPKNNTTENLS